MRDLKTVFGFELSNKLKEKTVRLTTIIILVIILIATFIPTLVSMLSGDSSGDSGDMGQNTGGQSYEGVAPLSDEYGYVIENNAISEEALKTLYPFFQSKSYPDEKALRDAIEKEEIKKGILVTSATSFKLIANDLSMYDTSVQSISASLSRFNRDLFLSKEGIDPAKVDQAENVQIQADTEILGKNALTGYAFAYVGMFMIYMLVILYGNSVATSVAREKNDRTMELLITNPSSNNLIWGKVLASMVVSIGQLILMILVAGAGMALNKDSYPEFMIRMIQEGITIDALVLFIVFALFGSLMYYFLYASVGALVSKVEEVNSAMTPIQFVFIAAFLLCSMGLNMPDGTLMRVISIVPFTSPMAMFIRYSMTTVPIVDLIGALVLLLVTLYIMAYLATRIYRMGTLNYGNRIGFFKAVGMVFKNVR